MDGPNVNYFFFSKLCNYQTENNMSKLLSTGSCGLHAIHGALKIWEQNTDWKLKKFWEPCVKFCTTYQLGEMILLMWLEVVNFVGHGGSKLNR